MLEIENLIIFCLFVHLFSSFFSPTVLATRDNDKKKNSLLYNTTSGIYEAKLIKIGDFLDENSEKFTYVHRIMSIPYGEKPERFQQAVMKKYQPGIHDGQEPIVCYQSVNMTSYGLFHIIDVPKMTEDCLTMSLYIPVAHPFRSASSSADFEDRDDRSFNNMPVVVHIHGGSNMVGGSALFDGSILASHGRIVVAIINYRLSVLGFLTDMTKKYPGNYGLRDQILAIKWLKLNCPVLNCNPNAITLWGHSAGAGDVNWLSISPTSNNLFQRVIIQSGSAFSYWGFDKMAFERYKSFRTYFNCTHLPPDYTKDNNAMTLLIEKCLMNASLDDLFSFKFALIDAPGPINDEVLGEDALITARYTPNEMVQKRNSLLNLDILTGINGVEGFSFEGYFSSSVKFWAQNNFTTEVILTLERFSLLVCLLIIFKCFSSFFFFFSFENRNDDLRYFL
jgi:carboxylesterase type B